MTPPRAGITWLMFAATIAIVPAGRCAHGQDDADEQEAIVNFVPRQQAGERMIILQHQRALLAQKKILQNWINGNFGTVDGLRDHLQTRLAVRIANLHANCQLSESQRNKLQLAGRGDIKRMLDRLDFILEKSTQTNTVDWQTVASEARDLKDDVEEPFEENSLFSKTQGVTLSDGQIRQNVTAMRDKNLVRYREAINQTVRRLARLLKLSNRQCDELTSLITTETMTPIRFGRSDYAFVMFQISRIPEAKLRGIFLDWQWKTIKPQIASWGDSGKTLHDEGFEFDDPLPSGKGAGDQRNVDKEKSSH